MKKNKGNSNFMLLLLATALALALFVSAQRLMQVKQSLVDYWALISNGS